MVTRTRITVRALAAATIAVLTVFSLASCQPSIPVWARLANDGMLSIGFCFEETIDRVETQLRADDDETVLSVSGASGPATFFAEGQAINFNDVAPDWTYLPPLDYSVDWDSYWVRAYLRSDRVAYAYLDRADLPDDEWHEINRGIGSPTCTSPDSIVAPS